jgi:hypothetical protein
MFELLKFDFFVLLSSAVGEKNVRSSNSSPSDDYSVIMEIRCFILGGAAGIVIVNGAATILNSAQCYLSCIKILHRDQGVSILRFNGSTEHLVV